MAFTVWFFQVWVSRNRRLKFPISHTKVVAAMLIVGVKCKLSNGYILPWFWSNFESKTIFELRKLNFFWYLKIWSENKIKLEIYFCKLYFANCSKLTPAANTQTSPMTFQDPLLPISILDFFFNFRKVEATFPIFVGMCYIDENKRQGVFYLKKSWKSN